MRRITVNLRMTRQEDGISEQNLVRCQRAKIISSASVAIFDINTSILRMISGETDRKMKMAFYFPGFCYTAIFTLVIIFVFSRNCKAVWLTAKFLPVL